ncbi:MAG: 4-(cytidine 5'-diphospho)-2-C-methyl-D-erythritol kinase [Firmicutes bacterium]|nr:4-(cytidine 5'-diphospho)-2-C-methyl-D-erythritol kinase [Bacillota bacterium]
MKTIILKAWAKINLTLDVLEKRADGYHNLASVMQTVGLYDSVSLEKAAKTTIKTNSPNCPANETNLAYKAAKRLLTGYSIQQGVAIEIYKNIPIAAGLAGGSADCAATLHGINELFDLKIPQPKLLQIAAELGADVPFCLLGGTQLAEGTGTKLTELPKHPNVVIVLAYLPIKMPLDKTAKIYQELDKSFFPKERQTETVVNALKLGNISKIAENLSNNFTPVVSSMYMEVLELIAAFRQQDSLGVNMTGSGPTVFAYFETEKAAFKAVKKVSQSFPNCVMYCVNPRNI